MHLKHRLHIRLPSIKQITHTHNTMTSTMLYDKACIAAEKANTLRFRTKSGLSTLDELCWYNNNTNWDALSRKEFREIMIRMESITAQFYEDFGTGHYRSAAIKKFWADEWRCEYLPESGHWFDLVSNNIFISQTEKAQSKAAKKAQSKAEKAKKAKKNKKKNAEDADGKAKPTDEDEVELTDVQQEYLDMVDTKRTLTAQLNKKPTNKILQKAVNE